MAKLKIHAPDGQSLSINVPNGTDPNQYDSIVEEVISDYTKSKQASEDPGVLKSAAAGVMSGIPLAQTAASGIMAIGDKTYEQAHGELEDLKNKAWDQHPVAYGTGKVAGLAGTAALAPEALGSLGVSNTIGQAAIQGAGYGIDQAKNFAEAPKDAIIGAATGAGAGVIGEKVISPLINKMLPAVAKGGLASLGKETTTKDIESYLNNPSAIKNALTKPQLAEELAGATSEVGKASGMLSQEARGLINPEVTPLNSASIKATIDETASKYLTEGVPVTSADKIALNTLNGIKSQLDEIANANGGVVPEDTLRSMIDRLQAATKESTFGNPDASASQDAMKLLSGKLNEALRKSNPQYAESMQPSAEAAQLASGLQSKFSIEGGQPTDTTASKLGNALKEGKTDTQDLLGQLKGLTGQDFLKKLQDTSTKEAFDAKGAGAGLQASLGALGYGMGRATHIPYGGYLGAIAGKFGAESFNGGQIAMKIMDAYLGASEHPMGQAISKFAPLLINAAKQGGNSLASTHFVLATSNPEYQQLVDHMNEGDK